MVDSSAADPADCTKLRKRSIYSETMSELVVTSPALSTSSIGQGARRHTHRAEWFLVCALAVVVLAATACSSKGSSATPSGTANQLVGAGLAAQQQGLTPQAKQDYQAAIGKDPNNKYAYYDLGVMYQKAQDAVDASID